MKYLIEKLKIFFKKENKRFVEVIPDIKEPRDISDMEKEFLVSQYDCYKNKDDFFKDFPNYNINEFYIIQWRKEFKQPKTCRIHHELLINGEAKVKYGSYMYTKEYIKAQIDLFPNSKTYVIQGILPKQDNDILTSMKVEFCPKCRQVEEEWLNHGGKMYPFDIENS